MKQKTALWMLLALLAVSPAWAEEAEEEAFDAPAPATTRRLEKKAAIAVAPVERLNPDSVGALDEAAGGFSITLWEGMSGPRALKLLQSLPTATASPVTRALMERLLLTAAAPPGLKPGELLKARLDALQKLESHEALQQLLNAVPAPSRDEGWYHHKLTQQFFQQAFAPACNIVFQGVALFPTAFWQEKLLFCQGLNKEFSKAAVTVELMREQNRTPPEWLRQLMLVWGQEPPAQPGPLKTDTAIDFALLGAAPAVTPEPVPAEAQAYPAMRMRHETLQPNARLQAAEEAILRGSLPVAAWAQLGAVEGAEHTALLQDAAADTPLATALERAQAYQAFGKIAGVKETATALRTLLSRYQAAGLLPLAARIYGKEMAELSRAIYRPQQLPALAPYAYALLFHVKQFTEAQRWREAALTGAVPLTSGDRLWSLLFKVFAPLAGQDAPDAPYEVWLAPEQEMRAGNERFWRRAGAVLEGLGYQLSQDFWRHVPPAAGTANPAVIAGLEQAARGKRKAETLGWIFQAVGSRPEAMDDATARAVLRSLRQLELEEEALELAHELIAAELLRDLAALR